MVKTLWVSDGLHKLLREECFLQGWTCEVLLKKMFEKWKVERQKDFDPDDSLVV